MLNRMYTDPTPHLFWITSRAAGFVALLKGRTLDLRATHEVLSLTTIVAIVIHAGALLGDRFLHPSLADIAIPFVSSYKSVWMTLGIVSGWALIALGLSYYARRSIGAVRWRKLHRFTALAWLGGLVHSLGMGTDAGQLWFLAMIAIVAIPALALLVTRVLQPGRVPSDKPGRAGHRLRPTGTALGQRDRVKAPARDDHERVVGVGVDGDPPARTGLAPAFKAG